MSSPAPDAGTPPAARRALVLTLFALTGAAGLAQEVAWSEAVARTLGHGSEAVALVAGVFLAGLAAGAALGGRLAAASRRPLALYGCLELGVAATSSLLIFLLPRMPTLAAGLGQRLAPERPGAIIWQVLLVAPLLLPPTVLMGATLPALARWWTRSPSLGALAAGRLAATNAAGGAAGALLAVFVALPAMGTRDMLGLAAALTAGCGATALAVGRREFRMATGGGDGPRAAMPGPVAAASTPRLWLPVLLLAAGCASLISQMAWTRALSWLIGSSVYSFGLILAATVAGLAGGAWLGAGPARRARCPLALFRRVETLAGVAVLATAAAIPLLPPWLGHLAAATEGAPRLLHLAELGVIIALLALPTLLFGAAFPAACRMRSGGGRGVARGVGQAHAWLTAGNVAGAALSGFILPHWVGSRGTLMLAGALLLAVAAASHPAPPRLQPAGWLARLALPGLALALVPPWDPAMLGTGPVLHGHLYVAAARATNRSVTEVMRRRGQVVFAGEGPDALVTVRRDAAGVASLQINGRTEASTGADMAAQILAAHVPLLHAARVRDVLVVGLASGVTAGSVLAADPERVVVAELAPTVVAAATSGAFDAAAGRPLADPRLEVVVADIRSLLLQDRRRYDVIASQPSNPWVPGVAGLYTVEFLHLAQRRLQPGGVFGQWVQAYGMPTEDFRRVLRTFAAVYPHCALFEEAVGGGDYFLVGSPAPLERNAARLLARFTPALRSDLRRAGLEDPADLLARRVLDAEGVRRMGGSGPLLTDDDLRLAYTTPLALGLDSATFLARLLETARPPALEGLDLSSLPPGDRLALEAAVARQEGRRQQDLVFAELLQGVPVADLALPGVQEAAALARAGLVRAAYGALGEVLATSPGPPALQVLAGDLAWRLGEAELAAFHYRTALDLRPDAAAALVGLGGILLAAGDPAAARPLLERAVLLAPAWARAWSNLGVARRQTGDTAGAETAYRRAVALQPQLTEAWENLATLRNLQDDPQGAEAALRAGLAVVPAACALRGELSRMLRQRGARAEAARLLRACPQNSTGVMPADPEAPVR